MNGINATTMRLETLRAQRWLLASILCGALLAQMALPAVHAIETGRTVPHAQSLEGAGALPVAHAPKPHASHDPATCPVCQSLLRANPLGASPAPRSEICLELGPTRPVAPTRAWYAVALIGHRSRAPPLRTLHLA
jgi:hypothetical protein